MPQPEPRFITAAEVAQVDLPPGGSTGQVLAKTSNADRAVDWTTVAGTGDVVGPASATTDNLAVFADETGKLLKDGGAPGGGGSFLSANTARVDPSGNDGTGEVGDLSKPFLTVQGAIDAIVDLALPELAFVVDVGSNQLVEDLTIEDHVVLAFVGSNCDTSSAFNSITISAQATIYAANIALGDISTSASLTMFLQESRTGSINSTASLGTLTIGSYYNTGATGEIIADDVAEIYVFGIVPNDSTTIGSVNATEVTLRTVKQNSLQDGYDALFSVSAPAAAVSLTDSLLDSLECLSSSLLDSRVINIPTIPVPVEYENILLPKLGYDFGYDFSRDGGASTSLFKFGEGLFSNFVVTDAYLEIVTPLESGNSLATAALGVEIPTDLQAATLVSDAPWDTIGVTKVTILTKLTSPNPPLLTIAVEDLTAGAFNLHIEGYIHPVDF